MKQQMLVCITYRIMTALVMNELVLKTYDVLYLGISVSFYSGVAISRSAFHIGSTDHFDKYGPPCYMPWCESVYTLPFIHIFFSFFHSFTFALMHLKIFHAVILHTVINNALKNKIPGSNLIYLAWCPTAHIKYVPFKTMQVSLVSLSPTPKLFSKRVSPNLTTQP